MKKRFLLLSLVICCFVISSCLSLVVNAKEPSLTKKINLQEELKNYKVNIDEFEGISWIYSKENEDESNNFYCYIGMKGEKRWLRFVIKYYSSSWLFIENIKIKYDKNIYERDFDYGEVKRDVSYTGNILEWVDLYVDEELLKTLISISNSEVSQIKFTGDTYSKVKEITPEEKAHLKDILSLWEKLQQT